MTQNKPPQKCSSLRISFEMPSSLTPLTILCWFGPLSHLLFTECHQKQHQALSLLTVFWFYGLNISYSWYIISEERCALKSNYRYMWPLLPTKLGFDCHISFSMLVQQEHVPLNAVAILSDAGLWFQDDQKVFWGLFGFFFLWTAVMLHWFFKLILFRKLEFRKENCQ